jgi:excinuclease ABC subunit C
MDDAPVTETNIPEPALRGPARIQAYLKTLPDAPGVYRMLDAKGDVLYVGKAKSLKKRVASYVKTGGHNERIARMVADTAEMLFVTTASETEALLLESNLIKRLKPRYNVSFRDDKSFPNILLREDHRFAQILKHRGAKSVKGVYFGPFASAGAVNRTLNALQRAFLLRSCSDSVFESRTRPCLLFQIKRCSAPCTGRIDEAGYEELVDEAEAFLTGKSRAVQAELVADMNAASESLDFERAARLRDRLRALSHVHAHQGVNPSTFSDADMFAAHTQGGETCVQVFFFRGGQNWGNRPYFPRHDRDLPTAEVLEAFIGQFYDERPAPVLVVVSETLPNQELLAEALSLRSERKVEVLMPQRGEKRQILDMALQNAREQLGRRQAENGVYDNSHIQGTNALGAMIVSGPEGFEKGEYRKWNIKSTELTPGDDYGMMREVLTRRFSRLVKESEAEDAKAKWPDLVLIDGGPGQLAVGVSVLEDLGVEDVMLVGISKGPDRDAGREHFYMKDREPFRLDTKSPVLYYLQRLRDEAHRFAIGSHRKKRSKAIGANPLDEIAGVGASRKRALLQHFGSARAVAGASLADLKAVGGVSSALARKIYDFFHVSG